jgi:serine/threonine-protein kinase
MDERQNEVAGEGQPERALSIEDAGGSIPGASVETPGNLTGTTIGDYLIGERIGGGSMATVYRAHDQVRDRSVAIKVLLPGADSTMQARFLREAKLVRSLVHPHIVRTLQDEKSGGITYIAMELVEGISLGDLLERNGKLSVADAAHILAPVAKALAYAHGKGIIHRDVKPSNILLKRANPSAAHSVSVGPLPYPVIPLLSDFGIARALDAPELTFAGRTIGTPAYMAPEQCAGSSDIDGRADIYALGAVLYRCLIGKAPFAGTTTQILHAHVYDAVQIPVAPGLVLPVQVEEIIKRAMSKQPAERFARAELMALALEQVADLPMPPAGTGDLADPTMTMASLPVTPPTVTARVLVPAVQIEPPRPTPVKPAPRPTYPLAAAARAAPPITPTSARRRSRRSQWGIMAIGGTLAILMVMAIALLVNSMLPGAGEENPPIGDPTPTPAAVAIEGTPDPPGVVPDVSPGIPVTVVTPSGNVQAPEQNSKPTQMPTPAGPTPTPLPQLPSEALEQTWDDAVAFFDEGDWVEALEKLVLVQNTIDRADYLFEREIDPRLLQQMLVTTHVGLATEAAKSERWDRAIRFLTEALELAPENPYFAAMIKDLEALVELQDESAPAAQEQSKALLDEFAKRLASYADVLEANGNVCHAAIHIANALVFIETEDLQARQIRLEEECGAVEATDGILETGGTILYSSEASNGTHNIWRFPISDANLRAPQSTQIVANGAQPQLSPTGNILAYYIPPPGNDGLYGIQIGASLTPSSNSTPWRFGPNPEDSKDGPASWNPTGFHLAYSTAGTPAKIYVTTADDDTSALALGDGKDPAWSPDGSVLVFNGPDMSGANPGLRAMAPNGNGGDRTLLIDANGNDIRPTWSPDGRYVVFMSKDRLGNSSWEVYRLDWKTREVMRLTDGYDAQDGLPTVSPDGKWVAFMSDRSGRWMLYYVSIDGGPVHLLSDISGQPIDWLEHAIQWVK